MLTCKNCNAELNSDNIFCPYCGTKVEIPVEVPVEAPVVIEPVVLETTVWEPVQPEPIVLEPVQPQPVITEPVQPEPTIEEEFIQNTARISRWEQKAYRIYGKIATIVGAVLAGLYFTAAIGTMASIPAIGATYLALAFVMACAVLIPGIICSSAAKKIDFYFQNMYTNPEYMLDRCGSAGMFVFSILFGGIALIFFIINFARIENNRQTVQKIYQTQRGL